MITIRQTTIRQMITIRQTTTRQTTTRQMTTQPAVLEPTGSPVTTLDERTQTEDGPVAHIVRTEPGEDAAAKVLAARIEGTPIEALCGHVWVPARDPKQLPVCQKCRDIYEAYRGFNENLDETPRM